MMKNKTGFFKALRVVIYCAIILVSGIILFEVFYVPMPALSMFLVLFTAGVVGLFFEIYKK